MKARPGHRTFRPGQPTQRPTPWTSSTRARHATRCPSRHRRASSSNHPVPNVPPDATWCTRPASSSRWRRRPRTTATTEERTRARGGGRVRAEGDVDGAGSRSAVKRQQMLRCGSS
jgi:hypothetical protein